MPNINFRVDENQMRTLQAARDKRKQSWAELFIGLLPVEERTAPVTTEPTSPPVQ